jgi:serine/threonine protein kinase
MKSQLLKAKAKKDIFLHNKKKYESSESDSADSLSSDDEDNLDLEITGDLLNNKYIAIKYLSRGTFSKVWFVYDLENKIYHIAKIFDKEAFPEFENEKKIFEIIKSDNIVKLYDFFNLESNGVEYKVIIYELLGISLLDVINDIYEYKYKLDLDQIKDIYTKILIGFKDIHDNKIIHCDIKPDNILLDLLPYKTTQLIEFVDNLDINKQIENITTRFIPEDFTDYNKTKKKNIKKKIKQKTFREIKELIIETITEFRKLNIEENIIESDFTFKYDHTKILSKDFKIKIIDFSNSELSDDISVSEIFTRPYRPIENIINLNYNCKADIWAIGCILYEVLTGIELFDDCSEFHKNDRAKAHLYKITKTFGPIDTKLIENCELYDEIFYRNKIDLKNLNNCEVLTFEHQLLNNIIFDVEEKTVIELGDYLKLCFVYNPNMRINCDTLILYLNNIE